MAAPTFYVDEDPHQDLAVTLRAASYDALSTREAGNKRLSDARQLEFATERGRVIITCNARDFASLHEALVLWSRRAGVGAAPHAGILVIPSGSLIDLHESTRIIIELAQSFEANALQGRLFDWLPRIGWRERPVP